MFFGNEKRNRKSCSEEKKVKGKTIYFYGLESGLGSARRKLFRVARRFISRRERFWKIFGGFYNFFCNFLENFYNFLENFCDFWKISTKIFAIFFDFCDFLAIFPENFSENFSENSRSQSVTVQPGSRHIVSLQVSLQVSLHLYL